MFFDRIVYSSSNEDGDSERRALRNARDLLCVTGSGSRVLELLDEHVNSVAAVDLNAKQNHLLELYAAAIRRLEYEAYVAFVGLTPAAAPRTTTYRSLRDLLSARAGAFWDANLATIDAGVLYSGYWEKCLRWLATPAVFRQRTLDRLLNAADLPAQRDLWVREWDGRVWRGYLRLIASRGLWVHVFREPGIHIIPPDFAIADYVLSRFEDASQRIRFSESAHFRLFIRGRFAGNGALPLFLQRARFNVMKANVEKITVHTESLEQHLAGRRGRYDGFSLSDFSSYAPLELYAQIWRGVELAARPGAVACERQFLVKRDPFPHLTKGALRNDELAALLNASDRSIVYTFAVATFH